MDYSDMAYTTISLGTIGGILIVTLILCILMTVSVIIIYRKGGYAGWEALIPIYGQICWVRLAGINPLLLLLCFVPFANIVFLYWSFVKVLKCFGCDVGMILLVLFLPCVGAPILAFSKKYTYLGVV